MGATTQQSNGTGEVQFERVDDNTLRLVLSGSWRLKDERPSITDFEKQLQETPALKHISFDTENVSDWDTGLVTYLSNVVTLTQQKEIDIDKSGLPDGAHRLLDLAFAVPKKEDTGRAGKAPPLLARIGLATQDFLRGAPEMVRFVGEATLALGRFFTGKAQYRSSDLAQIIQETGPQALPIVSLISFLVGMILAYMGAVQLAQFGAQIYIANLVAVSMVREMAALMTGIIMAGRTGAAFAAQLGTMQVNEEIDAFRTLGISPMDFLVLPRMLALIIMMPLLTLYAGIVGMLAGLAVAVSVFDIGVFEYYHQSIRALDLTQFAVGITKGTVYGILIAIAGCLRGIQCGRSAQSVGQATTSAVVTSIIMIVVAASVITIVFQKLGI